MWDSKDIKNIKNNILELKCAFENLENYHNKIYNGSDEHNKTLQQYQDNVYNKIKFLHDNYDF